MRLSSAITYAMQANYRLYSAVKLIYRDSSETTAIYNERLARRFKSLVTMESKNKYQRCIIREHVRDDVNLASAVDPCSSACGQLLHTNLARDPLLKHEPSSETFIENNLICLQYHTANAVVLLNCHHGNTIVFLNY